MKEDQEFIHKSHIEQIVVSQLKNDPFAAIGLISGFIVFALGLFGLYFFMKYVFIGIFTKVLSKLNFSKMNIFCSLVSFILTITTGYFLYSLLNIK